MSDDAAEMENMVVRILGDLSSYANMLHGAVKETEDAAKHVEGAAHKIEGFQHNLEGFAETAENALLRVGVVIGAWEAVERFEQAEGRAIRLEAAIRANEHAVKDVSNGFKEFGEAGSTVVESTVAEYKKLQQALLETMAVSKGESSAVLKTAETYGLTGKAAEKATKDALALAATTGNSAEAMVRMSAAIAKGDFEQAKMFTRMIPQLRGTKDEMELLEKYQTLVSGGMAIMQKEAETVGGQLAKAKAAANALTVELGEVISKALMPIIQALTKVASWFNNMSTEQKEVVVSALALLAALKPMAWMWEKLAALYELNAARLTSLTAAQTLNNKASSAWVVIAAAVAYGGYKLGESLSGASTDYEKLSEEMERSTKLMEKVKKIHDELNKAVVEGVESKRDPAEREKARVEALEKVQKQVEDMERNIKSKEDKIAAFERSPLGRISSFIGNKDLDVSKKQVAEAKEILEKTLELKAKLEAMGKIESPLKKKIDEEVDSMYVELDTMRMTEDEKKRYMLESEGATGSMLKERDELARKIEVEKEAIAAEKELSEAHEKTVKDLDETIAKLKEEAGARGLSTDRAKLARMEKEFGDSPQVAELRQLVSDKEIAVITKQYQTPLDAFRERVTELNSLLAQGLDADVYNRALEDATKKFEAADKAATGAKEAVAKFDSVLAGSAEAKYRVAEFATKITEQASDKKRRDELMYGAPKDNRNLQPVDRSKEVSILERIARAVEKPKELAAADLGGGGLM